MAGVFTGSFGVFDVVITDGVLRGSAKVDSVQVKDSNLELPPYDEDADVGEGPEAVVQIRTAVRGADAVFFASPEYNSSIPGVLKNAVDWLSRPSLAESALRGKPVAVVGASTSVFGAVWAQAELRKVLGASGARVVDGEDAVGRAMDRFGRDGGLNDESLEEQLREVVDDLLAEAERNDRGTLAA
ncbi:MAG: NAD(P)H-dependent oxidoreductase [Actinomycetota bacterium]|nr:NAD(P)H-dependent oxidoreductase [Actinomycetota bacterium]